MPYIKNKVRPLLLTLALSSIACSSMASDTGTQITAKSFSLNMLLGLFVIFMLLVNIALAYILTISIPAYKLRNKKNNTAAGKAAAMLGLVLLSCSAHAQETAATTTAVTFESSEVVRFVLYTLLFLEVALFFFQIYLIKFLIGGDGTTARAKKFNFSKYWTKINNFRPIEEEGDIDTGHEYDGIRELNNATPKWFIAAFTLSIVFAIVYMWRYEVVKSAPSQIEEYEMEVTAAQEKIAAYLKTQQNNVDETNVQLLDAAGISSGQALFATNCAVCHGDKGQGAAVGPNLSDEYWLHKGSLKDIFYSIKYGWPEKGMRSWKEDFSPNQIAQIASYVYSLKGSNPAGAKEPQGELYTEEGTDPAETTGETTTGTTENNL